MTKFADHLYENLMDEHGDALSAPAVTATATATATAGAPARRRFARPVWASAGTIAAAATAAVGFTVFGGTSAAYAVTDNHDGTLTIKVDKPGGIAGANAELRKMHSRVAVVEAKPGCPSIETFRAPDTGHGGTRIDVRMEADPSKVTVSASGLPEDETALVVYSFDHGKAASAMVPIKGEAPTCVSLPAVPPPGSVVTDGSGQRVDSGPGDAPGLSQQGK